MKHPMKNLLMTSALLLASASVSAQVKFVPQKNAGPHPGHYSGKPNLAFVEATAPLTARDRQSLTTAQLIAMNQEQLDQIYARLPSGPVPAGDFKGTVLIKNEGVIKAEGRLFEALQQKGAWGLIAKLAKSGICSDRSAAECLAEMVWSGKRFYAPDAEGSVQLRNAITPRLQNQLLLRAAGLTSMIGPMQRARPEKFNGEDRLMLFPANVFCGLSLFDARRESVVIDYAYGDDFQPYIPEVDSLFGRNGMWIRDEIRMVRPGLYLGRAYIDRVFFLNFVLENAEAAAQASSQGDRAWKNACWSGPSWQ